MPTCFSNSFFTGFDQMRLRLEPHAGHEVLVLLENLILKFIRILPFCVPLFCRVLVSFPERYSQWRHLSLGVKMSHYRQNSQINILRMIISILLYHSKQKPATYSKPEVWWVMGCLMCTSFGNASMIEHKARRWYWIIQFMYKAYLNYQSYVIGGLG